MTQHVLKVPILLPELVTNKDFSYILTIWNHCPFLITRCLIMTQDQSQWGGGKLGEVVPDKKPFVGKFALLSEVLSEFFVHGCLI